LVHEGRWSVEGDEEGRFSFVAPTEIGPETNEPLCDGSALDYGVALRGLVAG
jgi:hypothetical protein